LRVSRNPGHCVSLAYAGLPVSLLQPPGIRTKQNFNGAGNNIIMSKLDKAAARKPAQRHERDTGSSEVQVTTLTKRIEELTGHLKTHKKDFSSRYGLLRMVNNRRNLLDYLKRNDPEKHQALIKTLGLRH